MYIAGTFNHSDKEVTFPTKSQVFVKVDENGDPVEDGGGGGTSGSVTITNWPDNYPLPAGSSVSITGTVTVSGPLTNAQLTAVTGTSSVAPWTGTGNGTEIAILKAIYNQNESIKAGIRMGAGTDRSGSIAAINTSQVLAAQNTNRTGLYIQNLSDEDLYVSEFGAASIDGTSCYKIGPGQGANIRSTNAVTVAGSAIGQRFVATETGA